MTSRKILILLVALFSYQHARSQRLDYQSFIIQFTGSMAFDDTVKTYLYFINDTFLLVEQTSIVYREEIAGKEHETQKQYDPIFYYWINRQTKRHKRYKVSLKGEILFEGEYSPNTNTKPFDVIYSNDEPAFTSDDFQNKSTRIDSGDVTIVSVPRISTEFTVRCHFKRRESHDQDLPSLSPLGDSLLNMAKYCYLKETYLNNDPSFFGKIQIVKSYFQYPKQKKYLELIINRIHQQNE